MKHKLWLFYPENDIALAQNIAGFTPPPAAAELQRACEILPIWMADDSDRIICNGINDKWLTGIQASFDIKADIWNHNDYTLKPNPWGWSKASRRIFINNGFPTESLPDDDALETWRQLSHRRTAAKLSHYLKENSVFRIWPAAEEVSDIPLLRDIIERRHQVVIKSPWSSSGRGVSIADSVHIDEAVRRASGTIKRQGSVMVEQYARERNEFALLYYCKDGKTEFRGLSLFRTSHTSLGYEGNIVASQDFLRSEISVHMEPDVLDRLIACVCDAIDRHIATQYSGPVGIDIMTTGIDGEHYIHIMEANLRYTMGFVALGLARFASSPGVFQISKGAIPACDKPLVVDGKLAGGTQSLVPPSSNFNATLSILQK